MGFSRCSVGRYPKPARLAINVLRGTINRAKNALVCPHLAFICHCLAVAGAQVKLLVKHSISNRELAHFPAMVHELPCMGLAVVSQSHRVVPNPPDIPHGPGLPVPTIAAHMHGYISVNASTWKNSYTPVTLLTPPPLLETHRSM